MELLTILLKIFGPTTTIGKWLRDNYEKKNYYLYHFAKSINLDSEKKNFEVIYHNALKKLREQKQEDVFELFSLRDIRDAYKDEFQRKGLPNGVSIQLDYQVSNNEKFALLKQSISADERDFRALLLKEIQASLSAQEQYQEGHFGNIKEKLDKISEDTALVPILVQEVNGLKAEIAVHTEEIRSLQVSKTIRHYDGEIQQIINLVNSGHQQAALQLFDDVRERQWSGLDDEQRYDLAIHAGKAHFELANQTSAAALFTELPLYNQNSAESFGLAALGYTMQGKKAMANVFIQKAFAIDPSSPHATLAKIDLLPPDASLAQLEDLVPAALLDNPMIGLEVAKHINAEFPEQRGKALEILESLSNQCEPVSLAYFEVRELTAIVLASKAIAKYLELGKALSTQVVQELEAAIAMYSETWDYYKANDLRVTKWHVPANRGVARKVLGQLNDAKRDFIESIHVKPTPFTYISLIALLAEHRKPMLETIAEIKGSLQLTPEQEQDLLSLEITALLDEGYYSEALTLLEQAKTVSGAEANIMWESMKAHAILRLDRQSEALELAITLAEKCPNSVHANYTAAEIALHTNDYTLANNYLDKTIGCIPEDCQLNLLEHITALAVSLGRYYTVIDLLDTGRFTQAFSKFTFRLLTSLYAFGRLDRAFEIAMPLFNEDTYEPLVWQIIIEHNEMIGNLPEAQKVAEKGMVINPSDPYFYAKVLAIQLKRQTITDAQMTINAAPDIFHGSNTIFNVLYNVALSAGQSHYTSILQWAYERRAQHLQSPQMHQHYVQFMQALATLGYQEPRYQMVEKDTNVELQAKGGKTLFITIEDQKLLPNSLGVASDLGKGLIGMKIGEGIVINGVQFSITHITSKYMFAYLNSTGILKTRNKE